MSEEKASQKEEQVENAAAYNSPSQLSQNALAPEEWKFTPGKFAAIASLLFGYMAAVFSVQMASAILTTINSDIGPSVAYEWISTSQVVPVAVFGPLVGRLGDIFGRRQFLLLGNICGLIGCVIAATAHNVNVVIGGGIFIGFASACQQLAWSALGEMVPKKYRGFAIGLFETCCLPPAAFGPVMANAMALHATWRWVYWVPFILNTIGVIMIFLFYRPQNQYIREEGRTTLQEIGDLDWVGFFLYGSGILLFLLGISFGGSLWPWKSAGPIAMIVIGLVLVICFGFWEAYYDQVFPFFPPAVLGDLRGVSFVLIGTFLYGMLYYSTAVLWPQQIQALYSTNLITVGWFASVLGMCGIVASPVFGYLFTFGHARWLFTFIIALATVASGCMAIVSPSTRIASAVLVGLEGVSVGGGMIVATAMVQMAVDHEYIGIVTALAVAVRNLGGAVGTVIYVSIFTGQLKHFITTKVAMPLAYAGVPFQDLAGVVGALTGMAPTSALASLTPAQLELAVTGVKSAYSSAFRVVYLASIAFGVVALVAAALTKNVDKGRMNKEIDIKLNEGAKLQGVTDTGEGHIITAEELEYHHHHGLHHRHDVRITRSPHVTSPQTMSPRALSPSVRSPHPQALPTGQAMQEVA
ncbi:MAG: hypothetical protein M1818_006544 [Claussenomyces sp. TS43310]|nr:MAG: hypothetical protein M1818_006544 [Claussenomyces sp. TS43310]